MWMTETYSAKSSEFSNQLPRFRSRGKRKLDKNKERTNVKRCQTILPNAKRFDFRGGALYHLMVGSTYQDTEIDTISALVKTGALVSYRGEKSLVSRGFAVMGASGGALFESVEAGVEAGQCACDECKGAGHRHAFGRRRADADHPRVLCPDNADTLCT
jgi:hypothetical protein